MNKDIIIQQLKELAEGNDLKIKDSIAVLRRSWAIKAPMPSSMRKNTA